MKEILENGSANIVPSRDAILGDVSQYQCPWLMTTPSLWKVERIVEVVAKLNSFINTLETFLFSIFLGLVNSDLRLRKLRSVLHQCPPIEWFSSFWSSKALVWASSPLGSFASLESVLLILITVTIQKVYVCYINQERRETSFNSRLNNSKSTKR